MIFGFPRHKIKLKFKLLCIQTKIFKYLICNNKNVHLYMCLRVHNSYLYISIRNQLFPVVKLCTEHGWVAQSHLYYCVLPPFWELLCPVPAPVLQGTSEAICEQMTHPHCSQWQGGVSSIGTNIWIYCPWRFLKVEEICWKGKQDKHCPVTERWPWRYSNLACISCTQNCTGIKVFYLYLCCKSPTELISSVGNKYR